MTEDIEDAAREEIRNTLDEVACLLHPRVTIIHVATDGCPLCRGPNPDSIVSALHTLATAPAPIAEILEALRCIAPFTAQLGGRSISAAFGQTVGNIIDLGRAEEALKRWLNQG